VNRLSVALLSFVVVSLASARCARAAGAPPEKIPPAEQLIQKLKPGHPRLLIDGPGFESLCSRVKNDPVLREWDKRLRRQADRVLKAPLPEHVLPDGKRLLGTSRRVLGHSYTLALAYRLHGDKRHADRLWRELETVVGFPDFNPRHFLDTAEMTHALAVAYDWLYDTWTENERSTIRKAIVELGLKPGLKVYRKGHWWPRSIHNWNQVCNGGLTLGALAVGDEEPELAGEILRGALLSVPLAMNTYAPDGAWGEGPGYWGYATRYNVVMLAALESALGTDFGLSGMKGFSQTGLFPIYMTGPTGRTFNFSDSGDRIGYIEPLFWLAQRFDLPICTWFATGRGRPLPVGMIWYQKPALDPAAAGLPLDRYWRNVEVVTLRSDWLDPDALFVGIQAGSNRVNHNHLDLGSFVLDALGHRWAVDLGGDNYNLPGYFGRQRYNYYRLRAEGHNTLVLDPGKEPDQDPKATARIERFVSEGGRAFAVADLTTAYAKQARSVKRGVAMLDRRAVLIQDELDAQKPADFWWFMHTRASVTLSEDGRTATLAQDKAKLTARLVAPAEARFEVRPAEPFSTSPRPESQRANKEFRKLTVHLPGTTGLRLAVLFTPSDDKTDHTRPPEIKPLAAW